MKNTKSESSINVSAGCNIEKAVDIINTVDDTNITVESEHVEPVINPEDIIIAAKELVDIVNSPDANSGSIEDGNINNSNSDNVNDDINTDCNNSSLNSVNDTENVDSNNSNMVEFSNKHITEEQHKELSRRGGRIAKEKHDKRRTAKDIFGDLLRAQLSRESIDEILGESAQVLGEDKTVYAVMCAKMIQIACAGDIKAFIAIRDTVGDKPAEEHHLVADVMTDSDRKMIANMKKRMDKQAMSLHNDNEK